jgi:predicted enzyme related to lactoylglutathione lyase
MSSTQVSTEQQRAPDVPTAATVDLKLEVVVIPVSDVERAKRFYEGLGWRLDADFAAGETWRVVQFTPPGSPCSIHFGKGLTTAEPGSFRNLYLVVSDMEAARTELNAHGANVSQAFHFNHFGEPPAPGPDPKGASYGTYATFSQQLAAAGDRHAVARTRTEQPGRRDADRAPAGDRNAPWRV